MPLLASISHGSYDLACQRIASSFKKISSHGCEYLSFEHPDQPSYLKTLRKTDTHAAQAFTFFVLPAKNNMSTAARPVWSKLLMAVALMPLCLTTAVLAIESHATNATTGSFRRRSLYNTGDSSHSNWLGTDPRADIVRPEWRQQKQDIFEKGRMIADLLATPQGSNTDSQSTYSDLSKFGWTFYLDPVKGGVKPEELAHLTKAFEHLRIVSRLMDWHTTTLIHDTTTTHRTSHGRVEYPRTGGTYEALVNFEQGILVAKTDFGPKFQNDQKKKLDAETPRKGLSMFKKPSSLQAIQDDRIVPLRLWSDVMFLGLQQAAVALYQDPNMIKGVEHFFPLPIQDTEGDLLCVLIAWNRPTTFFKRLTLVCIVYCGL